MIMTYSSPCRQGRRQKNFQEGPTEKRPKNSKKNTKISTIRPLPGGEEAKEKKRLKNSKKDRASIYFICTNVPCMKIQGGGGTAPSCSSLPTPMHSDNRLKEAYFRFRYSFIYHVTSTRRQRGDLFSLRVKLPPVTTSLITQR